MKLKSQKGESLIEMLVAVLVTVFGALLLSVAITTSAKVNRRAQSDMLVNFANETDTAGNSSTAGTVTITFGTLTETLSVTLYTQKATEGGSHASALYYYR